MTEKEVLLQMRKNIKERKVSVCINISCANCCYLAGKDIEEFCLRPFDKIVKDWEGLYIEKFGIESLVEELL